MLHKEEIIAYLQKQKQQIKQQYYVERLGLFGSYATNEQSEQSDIDLLIEFCPNTADISERKKALRKQLEDVFGKNIDLHREKYLKPYCREQILEEVLYV